MALQYIWSPVDNDGLLWDSVGPLPGDQRTKGTTDQGDQSWPSDEIVKQMELANVTFSPDFT